MSVDVVRPAVGDLVFQLYGKPLHPELFDILAVRKIRRADCQLTVWITRTGHVVSWENDDVLLTEVCASAGQDLPPRRLLMNHRLRNESSAHLKCAHGVHYQVNFQVEALPPDLFTQVHDEIVTDGGKRGLLHHFHSRNRLAMPPLGYITAETRPGCLFLSSFHTFPTEHTVVKTQSLIETGR